MHVTSETSRSFHWLSFDVVVNCGVRRGSVNKYINKLISNNLDAPLDNIPKVDFIEFVLRLLETIDIPGLLCYVSNRNL